jgi:transcriptional regulator with XRE-family HTH domain
MFDDIGHHRYRSLGTVRMTVDDLDRSIEHRGAADSEYADLLDAEVSRQRLIAQLVEIRKANGLTQAAVARTMNVGQSVVAEIESAKADIRFSTLDRYAGAVSGRELRLPPDQWDAFVAMLDRPAVAKLRLRRLLTEPSVLDR